MINFLLEEWGMGQLNPEQICYIFLKKKNGVSGF